MAFLALVSEGVLTDGEHSQANQPLSLSWLRSFPSTLFITPPNGWPWRTEMSSPSPQAFPVLSTKDHRIAAACSSGDSLPLLLTLCCDVSRTHLVMWLPCWKLYRALRYVQNKIRILSFLFRPWRNRAGVQFLFLSALPWTPCQLQTGMTDERRVESLRPLVFLTKIRVSGIPAPMCLVLFDGWEGIEAMEKLWSVILYTFHAFFWSA